MFSTYTLPRIIITSAIIFGFSSAFAQSLDLTCYNRIGGSWNFGTAPSACNVNPTGNSNLIASQFSSVIFQDARVSGQGRREYMSAMFPVLREMGTYYIKRRNPSVSDAEIGGFLSGLYALAEQETLWTHYRQGSDNILRYMRGDSLHGHGLMQVDDRSHVAALKQGKGVDLAYNMVYGLDIYYAAWKQAASARCVSSPSNYHDRARAAWAAYNGGPGAICRWPSNGKTDSEFNGRYNRQAWLSLVADAHANSSLNVRCLAEGTRPCTMGTSVPVSPIASPSPVTNPTPVTAEPIPVQPAPNVPVAQPSNPVTTPSEDEGKETYSLTDKKSYQILRSCSSSHCRRSGTILHGASKDQAVMTGREDDGWVEVRLVNRKGHGWLPRQLLVEL